MKRILGIDYGERNTGVAVSDPFGWAARGLGVIRAEGLKKLAAEILRFAGEHGAETVVLGYPKNMNNTDGRNCPKILELKERLEKSAPGIKIILWDERLSTVGATRALTSAELKKARERGAVDKIAAAYILQGYLDYIAKETNKNMINDNEREEFEDEDFEYETVVLTDDDGTETECVILDSREMDGNTYLLVVDADEFEEDCLDCDDEDDEDDDGIAYILKEIKQDDENYLYEPVDDDDEFDRVAKLFEEDNEDYEIE